MFSSQKLSIESFISLQSSRNFYGCHEMYVIKVSKLPKDFESQQNV